MPKQNDLEGMTGRGVGPVKIPEIEKAIAKYERKKEARCNESPGEVAAKMELRSLLHQHRAELPVNGDGMPFYRCDDRDYVLNEVLKVRKVEADSEAATNDED